jgi:hypothetical protein
MDEGSDVMCMCPMHDDFECETHIEGGRGWPWSRKSQQRGTRYFDKKLWHRWAVLSKTVSKLYEKNNAMERTLASNAGASAQLRRDVCGMEELIFTRVKWYEGISAAQSDERCQNADAAVGWNTSTS